MNRFLTKTTASIVAGLLVALFMLLVNTLIDINTSISGLSTHVAVLEQKLNSSIIINERDLKRMETTNNREVQIIWAQLDGERRTIHELEQKCGKVENKCTLLEHSIRIANRLYLTLPDSSNKGYAIDKALSKAMSKDKE